MASQPITVAIAQVRHGRSFEDFAANARARVAEAAEAGAVLVAFPETVFPGYPAWLDHCADAARWDHAPVKQVFRRFYEASPTVPGPETDQLAALAREHAITMVVGISERVAAGPGNRTLYNTLLTFGPDGRLANHHRKLMPTYTERMVWGAGDADGLRAVVTPAGRVGGLVCWEHWMPLARQALHESGEDLHVAAWPMVKDNNLLCSRHYAFEGRCFVLAAGGLLHRDALPAELASPEEGDPRLLRGGSCIIGPDGEYVTEPLYDQEATVLATLDPGRIAEEAMTFDATGHYSRPDCLRLSRSAPTRER